MEFGVSVPQDTTILDPVKARDYVQAAEGMGYDFLAGGEHVLGADITNRPGWTGPYDQSQVWREPFVFMGFVAACTSRIQMGTSIVVLPLRQTALVAKQAAEVDVLSNGRFWLGIGVGWNEVEFEAMNQDYGSRGARTEEQIEVLRELWTQEVVTHHGQWHHIQEAGINPLPVQRPIPIWMGGGSTERVLRRIGRLADGWLPEVRSASEFVPYLERMRGYAREAGRHPASVAICARLRLDPDASGEEWVKTCAGWESIGATHCLVSTYRAGYSHMEEHLAILERFKAAVMR